MQSFRPLRVLTCLLILLLLAVLLPPSISAADDAVFVDSASLSSRIYALPAAFGPSFPSTTETYTLVAPSDPYGCSAPLTPFPLHSIALVLRSPSNSSTTAASVCTFVTKALNAAQAGAAAMLVVNTDDTVAGMSGEAANVTISAAMVRSSDGHTLSSLVGQPLTVRGYTRPTADPSFFLMFGLALFTVTAAAFLSARTAAAKRRVSGATRPQSIPEDEPVVAYLGMREAIGFVVMASLALVVLFFFIRYLIYMLLAIFAIGGAQSFAAVLTLCLAYSFPSHNRLLRCAPLPPMRLFTVLPIVPAIVLGVVWLLYRASSWSFVLQDLLGVCLLLSLQRVLRLPNIKISFVLLSLAFLYDIFWVFLSPYFFSSSVMQTVAQGGSTGESVPMLLRLPRLQDELGGQTMLGLGDIALPGLLISYLLRFDYQMGYGWLRGYFGMSVVGYGAGLLLTYVALVVMRSGQPALLYLVPCTLYVVLAVAWWRGDVKQLWDGTEEEQAEVRAHAARMNGDSGGGTEVPADGQAVEGSDSEGSGMTASLLPRASNSSEISESAV